MELYIDKFHGFTQAVAELEAQVEQLAADKAAQQVTLQRLEAEVARLREGISKNRVYASHPLDHILEP